MTPTVLETRLREAEERAVIAGNLIPAAGVLQEAQLDPHSMEARRLFGQLVRLPDVEAMRTAVRFRESASGYTPQVRAALAKQGKALPDGSFPIEDAKDVEDAVDDFNRLGGSDEDKARVKAHIIKVARTVQGGTDKLPPEWLTVDVAHLQESARALGELGIPAIGDDSPARGVRRLRESRSAADLAGLGIPLHGDGSEQGDRPGALDGIPLLSEASSTEPGARHVRLTESMGSGLRLVRLHGSTGAVLGRIS